MLLRLMWGTEPPLTLTPTVLLEIVLPAMIAVEADSVEIPVGFRLKLFPLIVGLEEMMRTPIEPLSVRLLLLTVGEEFPVAM